MRYVRFAHFAKQNKTKQTAKREQTLTNMNINNVADTLGVTLQTVRNWLKIGGQYFSESATRQRGKHFTPSDIQQLQRIQELLAEGLTYSEIPERLTAAPEILEPFEEPPPETPEQPQDNANAIQSPEYLEQFFQLLEQQRDTYQETISAKDQMIDELKEDKKRLQDELERSKRPWWKRLG